MAQPGKHLELSRHARLQRMGEILCKAVSLAEGITGEPAGGDGVSKHRSDHRDHQVTSLDEVERQLLDRLLSCRLHPWVRRGHVFAHRGRGCDSNRMDDCRRPVPTGAWQFQNRRHTKTFRNSLNFGQPTRSRVGAAAQRMRAELNLPM